LPVLGIWLATIKIGDRAYLGSPKPERTREAFRLALLFSVVGLGLGALGLALTDASALRSGLLPLPGDVLHASVPFRDVASVTVLASSGVIEETGIRSILQLGLLKLMPQVSTELIADGLFVVLHASRLLIHGELPFVLILALINGRTTSLTRRPYYAMLVHSLANFVTGVGVLWFRASLPVLSPS
jgi:membrane protease YdiL (CAAX protease family)